MSLYLIGMEVNNIKIKVYYNTELYHHGIKGQKWGVRRYQNKGGGLTSAGKKRYGDDNGNDSNSNSGGKKENVH